VGPNEKIKRSQIKLTESAEHEWSQAKLAAVVGVTRQTINSIEKGRYHPNPRLAFKTDLVLPRLLLEVGLAS